MEYKPMRAGRATEKADGEPVELILSGEADDAHAAEAAAIAQRLVLLRGEGFSFADMAILLRARTHLSAYTDALEAVGAPYSLLDGQGFFRAQEITDMLNILRFLDNPLRDVPLLGLLRSPFFGLDDNSLTMVALSDGKEALWHKLKNFPPGALSPGQEELIARAVKILKKLALAARLMPPGPLLRAVIEELRFMPLLMAYPDGRQKYANMEKFVDIAFAFEQDTDGGLGEFLDHIDSLSAIGAREGLEQLEDEGSDAIKILTIHKSKGLEFKAVVLADCGAPLPVDRSQFFYGEDCGLGIKVRYGGQLQPTECFARAKENSRNKNMEEARRLLYVAMTRARDKLILSAGKKGRQSWLEWIADSFEDGGDGFLRGGDGKILLWEKDAAPPTPGAEDAPLPPPAAPPAEQEDFARLIRQTRPVSWQRKNRLSFSATALSDYRHCPKLFYYKYLAALPERQGDMHGGEGARPAGLPPRVEGLVAHSVLASLGKHTFQEALDNALAEHTDAEYGKAQRADIEQWLALYLKSPLWREAAARETWHEVGFKLPLLTVGGEPLWFSGSIDSLSFDGADGLWITDYKTDRGMDGKAEEYAPQMMIYALAAEMLCPGRKATKGELHFIRSRARAEVNITAGRETLVADIRKLCAEITARTEEGDFAAAGWCGLCGYKWFCADAK
jgi:ATP-dependent helicase/nuclease subunit A